MNLLRFGSLNAEDAMVPMAATRHTVRSAGSPASATTRSFTNTVFLAVIILNSLTGRSGDAQRNMIH
jgi:hypothetical protein